jgi:signal transduction histidine kinase/ActR/RegA family two-component response regulator
MAALVAAAGIMHAALAEPAMGALTHWLVWLAAAAVAVGLRFSLLVYRARLRDATIHLGRARQRALDAARAKSEFLANMRHEVRTPLTSVIGMAELLMTTNVDEEQQEYVRMARDASFRLMAILDDILDLSRVESGSLNIEPESFELRALLRDTLTPASLRARSKGLQFDWEVAADVPEVVAGDPKRVRQVLVNLVNNAIRFTEDGEVRVRVRRADPAEGEDLLHFTVTDTGIGISAESQERVFDAFTQADGSATRRYGGAGVGLAISAELVELMNGQIWLQSEQGAGSSFHFTARLPASERTPVPVASSEDDSGAGVAPVAARVLVAEDNPVNRAFAVAVLRRAGHEVLAVDNGKEALAAYDDESFDVVLLDLQMPEMDGLELAAAIRERERSAGGHIPIIAVTAHDESGQLAALRELGMDAHLTKPFRSEDLLTTIDRLLPPGHSRARRAASQPG